jgi:hypothetical protein
MRMKRSASSLVWLGPVLALSLALTACGGDKPASSTGTAHDDQTLASAGATDHQPTASTGAGGGIQPPGSAQEVDYTVDFTQGDGGWQAGYTDYPPADSAIYDLQYGLRELPAELNKSGTGFYIQGENRSDDLFMYLTKRLGPEDGVRPNRQYQLSMTIDLASNAPSACSGVGGAPGEGVTLKAGGSGTEPAAVPAEQGSVRLNLDKGEQTEGGADVNVVGDIANGIYCDDALKNGEPYVSLVKPYVHPTPVTSNGQGEIWIVVGTDSGYESLTALYYESISVKLTPSR